MCKECGKYFCPPFCPEFTGRYVSEDTTELKATQPDSIGITTSLLIRSSRYERRSYADKNDIRRAKAVD